MTSFLSRVPISREYIIAASVMNAEEVCEALCPVVLYTHRLLMVYSRDYVVVYNAAYKGSIYKASLQN